MVQRRRRTALVLLAAPLLAAPVRSAGGAELPEGYWSAERCTPILERTLQLRLAPDLEGLAPGERTAVRELLAVGELFQRLYEVQLHPAAPAARGALEALHATAATPRTRALLDLYRLFRGPVATTLDNEREAFLPVGLAPPGRGVYPADLGRAELEAFLAAHPDSSTELLHLRTVVRRATATALDADLATLSAYPVLDTLHPGLGERLRAWRAAPDPAVLYAVPYAVAWAAPLLDAYARLWRAADAVAGRDPDFGAYLRQRARDLLSNDYEAGDAAWVAGRFSGRLNAQIGAYETYDDELMGVKGFFGLSLLVRDEPRSAALREAAAGLQALEDALPYAGRRAVREGIPIGVYDVVADFGQARGTNTATILPNESAASRKYGRTILLRHDIMTHEELFRIARAAWEAALVPAHHGELRVEGSFQRTLWHEIGHYLGPDADPEGRPLDEALQEYADLIEEMKADLVSLFAFDRRAAAGLISPGEHRAVQAAGVLRVLLKTRPRRSQPYQTMQLMQLNRFLAEGLLVFDPEQGRLAIRYERYPAVVEGLLRDVIAVQALGDRAAAAAFVGELGVWREDVHEVLARAMRQTERYRYRLVRYAALGE